VQLADDMGLHREFVKQLYVLIHDESIRVQEQVMNAPKKVQAVS